MHKNCIWSNDNDEFIHLSLTKMPENIRLILTNWNYLTLSLSLLETTILKLLLLTYMHKNIYGPITGINSFTSL